MPTIGANSVWDFFGGVGRGGWNPIIIILNKHKKKLGNVWGA